VKHEACSMLPPASRCWRQYWAGEGGRGTSSRIASWLVVEVGQTTYWNELMMDSGPRNTGPNATHMEKNGTNVLCLNDYVVMFDSDRASDATHSFRIESANATRHGAYIIIVLSMCTNG